MKSKDLNTQKKTALNLKSAVIFLLLPILSLIYFAFYQDAKVYSSSSKLTPALLREAYTQYASYHESYMDLNQYLQAFPTQNYALYEVKDLAYFYLENKHDVIKSGLSQGQRWEPDLIKYMAQYVKKNTNVLDVGAHIGTHTIYLASLLQGQGTVYAFEPQKKLFMELNANLFINHLKNVKTLRFAIGEKKKVIEMAPSVKGNEGGTPIGQGGDKADQVSIDSLGIKNISFIKIDVEGYEDQVLAGAVRTIKANKPIILCEIMGGNRWETASPAIKKKISHTLSTFKALGYKVTRVGVSDYLAVPGK